MSEKCHFCKHDYGPLMDKPEECKTCDDFSNFKLKARMHPIEVRRYEQLQKKEDW